MKKGFTLIELIGVITLIAIVGLLSFVAINNLLKNYDNKTNEQNINTIYLATETYLANNKDKRQLLIDNNELILTVQDLADQKLIQKNILTSTIKLTNKIKVTINDNKYQYEFIE